MHVNDPETVGSIDHSSVHRIIANYQGIESWYLAGQILGAGVGYISPDNLDTSLLKICRGCRISLAEGFGSYQNLHRCPPATPFLASLVAWSSAPKTRKRETRSEYSALSW